MRIDLLFPKLPPALDGIGDYTARLAAALAQRGPSVRVLTAQEEPEAITGVAVERAFSMEHRRGVGAVVKAVSADPPDWLIVQFNQFSYGRWGLNPFLPLAIGRLRRKNPGVRVAVMFHEDFVPVTNWKNAVMTVWQRAQFWALGRQAELVGFSIAPWRERYQHWFPQANVVHWPVGSNMPRLDLERTAAKARLGFDEDTFVVGVFGTLHASRMVPLIARTARVLHRRAADLTVLYVGPDGDRLEAALPNVPVRDAGRLAPEEVSRHLSAMDVHLAPFTDGASMRRGSMIAGLQHGVPTVSTSGPLTDRLLRERSGEVLLLTPTKVPEQFVREALMVRDDPARRQRLGEAGRRFYDEVLGWDVLANTILDVLQEPILVST